MPRKNYKLILPVLISLLLLQGCSTVISENVAEEENKEQLSDYDLTFDETISDSIPSNATYLTLSGSNDLTISKAGTYVLSGQLNGSVIIDATKDETVQLVLNGVSISSGDFAGIYIKKAEKAIITLNAGSTNTISDSSAYTLIDDNNVDALIFSKEDLIINGEGTLTLNSSYNHGIVSKDNLEIHNGKININVAGQGICGKDTLKIKGGTIDITSGEAGLKSNNDEDDYCGLIYIVDGEITIDSTGDALHSVDRIQIDGGNLTINTDDDGIHSEGTLTINGGTINIEYSYEGLEGQYLYLNGGTIDITARDDGINAVDYTSTSSDSSTIGGFGFGGGFFSNTGTDCNINFNGSNITLNASGDGVDSNGAVEVNDGTVIIYGPADNGNAAFDYESGGYAYGGELIAVGTSGMATSFSSSSTQCNLLYNFSSSYKANTKIKILNSNSEVLFELTSLKAFNSILLTSSKLTVGETITIQIGDESFTYTLSSITNSSSSKGSSSWNMGGGGGFSRGGGKGH